MSEFRTKQFADSSETTQAGAAEHAKAAEQEGLPTATLIYRANAFFERQIPQLVATLEASGWHVKSQAFPAEARYEDIQAWSEEHPDFVEGPLLTDHTCALVSEGPAGSPEIGYLDRLYARIARATLLEGDHRESTPTTEELYSLLLRNILENKEQVPEKVLFFRDNIRDHNFKDLGTDDDAVRAFSSILETAGIPNERIEVKRAADLTERSRDELDVPGTWIIIDRHGWIGKPRNLAHPRQAHYFELPFADFSEQARLQGLLNISAENMRSALQEALTRDVQKPENAMKPLDTEASEQESINQPSTTIMSRETPTAESPEAFAETAQQLIQAVVESHKSHDPRYSPTLLLESEVNNENKTIVFSMRKTLEKLPVEGEQHSYSVWGSKNGEQPRQIFEDHGWPAKGEDPGVDFRVEEGVVKVESRKGEQSFNL